MLDLKIVSIYYAEWNKGGSTIKHEHWLNINTMLTMITFDSFKMSSKWTQRIRFFNEFHYILLNHLNLLEYNYIIVPPLNEFCEVHIFIWRGVQEFLISIIWVSQFEPFETLTQMIHFITFWSLVFTQVRIRNGDKMFRSKW